MAKPASTLMIMHVRMHKDASGNGAEEFYFPTRRGEAAMNGATRSFATRQENNSGQSSSEVTAQFLFAFDGFEEGFEVSFAEAAASFALDDFVEDGGTVLYGARKDLQHVALIVAIDEDAEAFEFVDGFVDLADALLEFGVVGVGDGEEVDSLLLHFGDCVEDIVGGEGDVLDARTLVEVEVLFDLGLAATFGWLVDGELDVAVAVGHHLGHQSGVFGGYVFVVEVLVEAEAHDVGVEVDPLVHGVPAYVADHVVDVNEANWAGDVVVGDMTVAGEEGAVVVGSVDEGVDGVPVGGDAGDGDMAVVVGELGWFLDAASAATSGLGPGLAGVVDPEGYGADAVAVGVHVAGDLGVGAEGGGEDEADFSLLEDVGGAVAVAGLRACVRDQGHAEGRAIEVGRLACVADVELDVVGTFEGEKIVALGGLRLGERGCSHGRSPVRTALHGRGYAGVRTVG